VIKISERLINHPLSVIDGRRVSLRDAFSWILHYYNPLKGKETIADTLDTTCGQMLMWKKEDLNFFRLITNDIDPKVDAGYHCNCMVLDNFLKPRKFDIIIYDPPYIDIKNRKDSEKYEIAFNYGLMPSIQDLKNLTILSSKCFNELLRKDGILIAKITDFHYKNRLRGSYDIINWFSGYFYLWDKVIFRFYKPIPNLNWYYRKCAKTHSYFLIFKKEVNK